MQVKLKSIQKLGELGGHIGEQVTKALKSLENVILHLKAETIGAN